MFLYRMPAARKKAASDRDRLADGMQDAMTELQKLALADILAQVHSLIISDPADLSDWTPTLCQFLDEIGSPRKRRPAAKRKK
jgi:hypothetical protein